MYKTSVWFSSINGCCPRYCFRRFMVVFWEFSGLAVTRSRSWKQIPSAWYWWFRTIWNSWWNFPSGDVTVIRITAMKGMLVQDWKWCICLKINKKTGNLCECTEVLFRLRINIRPRDMFRESLCIMFRHDVHNRNHKTNRKKLKWDVTYCSFLPVYTVWRISFVT